ncbi:CopD family protein [Primorskyibacter sp. S187A]|uniref:CopD family protein n=1 Tax=Primorskyibacter sp. S187A TaxID=3415130 RepID=UPI003C7EAE87
MLSTFPSADAITWLSILVKAIAYATTLLAIGSVLVLCLLKDLSDSGRIAVQRTAGLFALAAAIFSLLRLPIRASFLMGGTWDGALDALILGLVADSPLGTSVAVRVAGLTLIVFVLWNRAAGLWLALTGAVLASTSFALRGHALGDLQVLLGGLITLHILCLGFWVGAFGPLMRAVRSEEPAHAGCLAQSFGAQALWAIALLLAAGGVTLILFGAANPSFLSSPYGQMFAIKLGLFAGVMALAATNKLSLTPALLASKPGAASRLRTSIGLEATLVAGILITTAALTTLSSPPSGTATDQISLHAFPKGRTPNYVGDAS